jgi:hypothetical protein
MIQQALAVLLATALISGASLATPCPQGRCGLTPERACCQTDGLTRPSCCPPLQQVRANVASPAAERHGDVPPIAAGVQLPAPNALRSPPALAGWAQRASPRTTLFGQRTSLVL